MIKFHKIWIEQCAAARVIRDRFGTDKALGYLLGEKLLNFMREANHSPEFAAELPFFVEVIKEMFVPAVLADYLDNVHRIGVFGHVCDDETYEEIRTAGMVEDDAVGGSGGRASVLNTFAGMTAFRELAGTIYREVNWLVTDHLGTPRMVVDRAGSLAGVKRHDYLT